MCELVVFPFGALVAGAGSVILSVWCGKLCWSLVCWMS